MSSTADLFANPEACRRKWYAMLATIVLTFLSMTPACATWPPHGLNGNASPHATVSHGAPAHAPPEEPCCSSVESIALVDAADMLPWQTGTDRSVATLQSGRATLQAMAPNLHTFSVSVIPPASFSFYVRSARILR